MKKRILYYILILSAVFALVITLANNIPEGTFPAAINGIGLFFGFLYFFERLIYDKTTNRNKNIRERISALTDELWIYFDLVDQLTYGKINSDLELIQIRNKLQFSGLKIIKISETLTESKAVEQSEITSILQLVRYVENSRYFLDELVDFPKIDYKNFATTYFYRRGTACDNSYAISMKFD